MKSYFLVPLVVWIICGCKSSASDVNGNAPLMDQTRYLFLGGDLSSGDEPIIYRSSDDGLTWVRSDSGFSGSDCNGFASSGGYTITSNSSVPFRTSDNGRHWTKCTDSLQKMNIGSIVCAGNSLIAATQYGGMFRSMDNGASWTKCGFPIYPILLTPKDVDVLAVIGGHNMFLSTDAGISWTALSQLKQYRVNAAGFLGGSWFAASSDSAWKYGQVLRTTDQGASWSIVHDSTVVWSFAQNSRACYAITDTAILRTTDNGSHWYSLPTPKRYSSKIFVTSNDHLFVLGSPNVLYRSVDQGQSWQKVTQGLEQAKYLQRMGEN